MDVGVIRPVTGLSDVAWGNIDGSGDWRALGFWRDGWACVDTEFSVEGAVHSWGVKLQGAGVEGVLDSSRGSEIVVEEGDASDEAGSLEFIFIGSGVAGVLGLTCLVDFSFDRFRRCSPTAELFSSSGVSRNSVCSTCWTFRFLRFIGGDGALEGFRMWYHSLSVGRDEEPWSPDRIKRYSEMPFQATLELMTCGERTKTSSD